MGGKVIFTCLFGEYDELQQAPVFKGWGVPVLFTDKEPKDQKGWKVNLVSEGNPKIESRRYKLLSHLFLKDFDLVCYIDANMKLLKEPPSVPFWNAHPNRRKVIEEANRVIQLGKGNKYEIEIYLNSISNEGFKDNKGLFQNGFFVRRHSEQMNFLMQKTFDTVAKFEVRDQLSLPFACHLLNMYPEGLQRINQVHRFVRLAPHRSTKIQVHHITPARSDKDFGKAVNQIIEGLPDQDWICLRDIDTFPPYHEVFIKQIEAVANSNHGYSLLGCMTNRLGLDYQLVKGMFSEMDITKHREKAKELSIKNTIKPLSGAQTVGGVMMLFSKSTWLKAGKFPEGGIKIKGSFVDYHFSRSVAKFGKLGICEGIYLFHNYRIDSSNPTRDIKHLI